MNSLLTNEHFESFAKILASNLASETAKEKRKEKSNAALYSPTQIKPKIIKKNILDLFKNVDDTARKYFKESTFNCLEWPVDMDEIGSYSINDSYFFRGDLLYLIFALLKKKTKSGLWFHGERGVGKTSVIEQVCARIGYPLFQETGSARTEFIDLFGYSVPSVSGGMTFVKGALLLAMENGGVFLLNEIDAIEPSELIKLNELIQGKPVYVPQLDKWIVPHHRFCVIVTSNTNGTGDDSGNYIGTLRMSEAFKDRFWIREVKQLTESQESSMLFDVAEKIFISELENHNLWNQRTISRFKEMSNQMVKVANALRKAASPESLTSFSTPISFRGLTRWMEAIIIGLPYENYNVYKAGFLSGYADSLEFSEREVALEIAGTIIPNFDTVS